MISRPREKELYEWYKLRTHWASLLFLCWARTSDLGIPADLPDPRMELGSPALQADSLPTELSGKPLLYKGHPN